MQRVFLWSYITERQIPCFQKHMVALLPFIIYLYQTKLAGTGRSGNCSLEFRLVSPHMDSVFTSLCIWPLPSKSLRLSGLSLFLCFGLKQPVSLTQTPAQSSHSSQQLSASCLCLRLVPSFPVHTWVWTWNSFFCLRILSLALCFQAKRLFFANYYFTLILGLSPQSTPKHFTYSVQESVEGECMGLSCYFCILSYTALCHRNWLGDWQG